MDNMMQFLVSSIDGKLFSLSFPAGHNPVTLGMVKLAFEERVGLPAEELRISCNGRCLVDDARLFSPEEVLTMPPLRVSLRVVGGKGGFGSLLRGGNTRVGQKKTTNFDACRDLNGRRLRHVNNEKRLAEWYAQEKDRELAKLGEKHARTVQKQHVFDEEAYRQSLENIEQEVATSLQAGLEEARAARQHRQANPPPPPTEAAWDFAYPDDDDEEDEEEDDGAEENGERADSDDEEGEKEKANGNAEKKDKGKEKPAEGEDEEEDDGESGKRGNKRERAVEKSENHSEASERQVKKARKDEDETTTAGSKAPALPTPPEWILG